jgi:hypothetical protein
MGFSFMRGASERGSSLDCGEQLPLRTKIDDLIGSNSAEQGFTEAFLQQIWPKVEVDYKAMAERSQQHARKSLATVAYLLSPNTASSPAYPSPSPWSAESYLE